MDARRLQRGVLELFGESESVGGRAPSEALRFVGDGVAEQEGAPELMMEVLVGLDDIAIEGGGGPVACPLAELDELPVLHHGDGLPGELPRGNPLHGGGKLIEELEERTVALGHGIEAARVEAELAQT